MEKFTVYALGPIDFWPMWRDETSFRQALEDDIEQARITYTAELHRGCGRSSRTRGSAPLRTDGGPWVCPLLDEWPEDGWPALLIAMKIEMNGIVLLASPRRIPALESLSSETTRIP